MITLLHGDDTQKVWAKYKQIIPKGTQKIDIDFKKISIEEAQNTLSTDSLFETKRTVLITNLKSLHHTKRKALFNNLQIYKGEGDTHIVIVSDTQLDEKSLNGIKLDHVYAYPLPKYFFEYLDALVPGKSKNAISTLNKMKDMSGEQVFYATVTRMRLLILEKSPNPMQNAEIAKLSPYYEKKLRSQARLWQEKDLIRFYNDLFKIEVGLKSSNLPLTVEKHLDITLSKHLK